MTKTTSGRIPSSIPLDELDAGDLDGARLQALRIRRKNLEQQVLDDDGDPEGHQQRRQEVVAQRVVEDAALQQVAEEEHEGQHRDHADEGIDPGRLDHHHRDEGGEHDEIAMRDIHQPHHAEDDGEPGGKERVEPAREHALDDAVDPLDHGRSIPAQTAFRPLRLPEAKFPRRHGPREQTAQPSRGLYARPNFRRLRAPNGTNDRSAAGCVPKRPRNSPRNPETSRDSSEKSPRRSATSPAKASTLPSSLTKRRNMNMAKVPPEARSVAKPPNMVMISALTLQA